MKFVYTIMELLINILVNLIKKEKSLMTFDDFQWMQIGGLTFVDAEDLLSIPNQPLQVAR